MSIRKQEVSNWQACLNCFFSKLEKIVAVKKMVPLKIYVNSAPMTRMRKGTKTESLFIIAFGGLKARKKIQ